MQSICKKMTTAKKISVSYLSGILAIFARTKEREKENEERKLRLFCPAC
jgi:hypothetical protein